MIEDGGRDNGDEAGPKSNRKVDAAGHDDEDHAAGHDRHDRHLRQDVLDMVRRPVIRRRDPEPDPDGHKGHEQDVGPEILRDDSQ